MLKHNSLEALRTQESKNPRNEATILPLKKDIHENVKLLSELGLGTPIVAAIRSVIKHGLSLNNRNEYSYYNKLSVNENKNENEKADRPGNNTDRCLSQ